MNTFLLLLLLLLFLLSLFIFTRTLFVFPFQPSWTMYIQVMTFEQAEKFRWNPFDLTKVTIQLKRTQKSSFSMMLPQTQIHTWFSPPFEVRGGARLWKPKLFPFFVNVLHSTFVEHSTSVCDVDIFNFASLMVLYPERHRKLTFTQIKRQFVCWNNVFLVSLITDLATFWLSADTSWKDGAWWKPF